MHLACLAHDIPDDARRQLAAMAPSGVQALAFTPGGGWVVVGGDSGVAGAGKGYAARGIPDACFVKLGEFVRAGHTIRSVAFPARSGLRWAIVSDQGYAASGIPDAAFDALVQAWAAGLRPSCIAFPPDGGDGADGGDDGGGDGWVLLAGSSVFSQHIAPACAQALHNLAQGLRTAQQVAFAPGGGWVALAPGRSVAEGIADGCRAHLAQVAQQHLVEHVAFAPNGGWVVGSNTLKAGLPADPLHGIEDRFRLVNHRWRSVGERMAVHGVAAARVALQIDGRPAWVLALGLPMEDASAGWVAQQPGAGCTVSTHGGCGAAFADEMADALARLYAEPVTR